VRASTGSLGLTNSSDTITLAASSGDTINSATYSGLGNHLDQSLALRPDLNDHDSAVTVIAGFETHTCASETTASACDGALYSPGYMLDGTTEHGE
jgi:hypothetical protein